MQLLTSIALLSGCASFAYAQDLVTALGGYSQATKFKALLGQNPSAASSLLAPGGLGYTVLVPSDAAFDKYASKYGTNVTSLSVSTLTSILQYHILVAPLTKANFTQPRGVTVPTLLKGELNNNRTAGRALTSVYGETATGQVLYISKDPIRAAKFRVRQASTSINLRGGLAQTAGLDSVDGTFDSGRFQIVDSILEPPVSCSKTIRSVPDLLALDNALNRSGIWPVLDAANNVTCLAPNSVAFQNAGNADQKLTQNELIAALQFHTLPQPLYTNFLTDGQTVASVNNMTVKVYVRGDDVWFNDAKVVAQNVLTNNGLIHVLDKVMSENGKPPASTTSGSATGTSATPGATSSSAAVSALMQASGTASVVSALFGVVVAAFFA